MVKIGPRMSFAYSFVKKLTKGGQLPYNVYEMDNNTIDLTLETYANALFVSDQILQDINAEPFIKRQIDGLVLGLKAFIFGEQVQQEEVKYPADWKEAIKERWYPNWALKRWPVRYKVHRWDCRFVYPSIRPEQHKSYKIVIQKSYEVKWEGELRDGIR